ncbi:MAG: hypothetical protein DRH24_20085 [Deltaproteobacteria bacterium]|nr:MAG: hypothetical protein DRH24_20085 [Deltaproteobacteria bacterium]
MAKDRPHLVLGFEIELVRAEAHPVGVGKQLARIYAEQNLVRAGILPGEIVDVVGRNDGHA